MPLGLSDWIRMPQLAGRCRYVSRQETGKGVLFSPTEIVASQDSVVGHSI